MGYFDDVVKAPAPPLPAANGTPANGTPATAPGAGTAYARAALRSEADAVARTPEGGRNDALNRARFRMGRHVGAGNIDAETVDLTLAAAGRACGLPEHEIELIMREGPTGALANGAALPRHPAPAPGYVPLTPLEALTGPLEALGADAGDPEALSNAIRERFPVLDWRALWDTEDEEEEWIIEPLLPARRLVALFSAPKVGKSLLMLEVAARVAAGQPVLGVTPTRPFRVLYVDFENDPRGDVRTRLQAMGIGPEDLGNLFYLSYPTLAKLDTFMGAVELMAVVAEYGCEVVVIDTISRAVQGEENENDTWLAFYRNTGLALKQAKVACIRLDHTGKDHEKGMRGGSAKYGDVDAVWKLSRLSEDTYELVCTDHRMRVPEDTIVLHREPYPLTHRVAAEGRAASFSSKVDAVAEALDSGHAALDITRDDAAALLRSMGTKARNDVIGKALEQRRSRITAL